MSFADITVVGITGADSYTEGTMYAVARSCAELPGSRGLLISPSRPQGLPENILHQPCRPFGYLEYNLFVLYQLMYYIETDYCLIVQNDGWVLNGQNWQDAYREYDYIGAPLPILLETEADGQFFLKGTDQYLAKQHLIQTSPNLDEPQNGGFSLRSKRLLTMPRQLGLNVEIRPPLPPKDGKIAGMEWLVRLHHEDMFLTAQHRYRLQDLGLKFAPPNIATQFSSEVPFINRMRNVPLENVFGAHWMGSVVLTGCNRVRFAQLNGDELETLSRFFRNLGYELE